MPKIFPPIRKKTVDRRNVAPYVGFIETDTNGKEPAMSFIAKTSITAQDLATLAFNLPDFIESAEGSDMNRDIAIESSIEEVSYRWMLHSGQMPVTSVIKAATILLTEMADNALAVLAEKRMAGYVSEMRRLYATETWRFR